MIADRDWPNGDHGSIMFKWTMFGGLFMHVYKSSWMIRQGTEIPMSVTFDGGIRNGTGVVLDNGKLIQVYVSNSEAGQFMKDFSDSTKMTLAFPSSAELPWVSSMVGHVEAENAFLNCVKGIKAKTPEVNEFAPAPAPAPVQITRPVNKGAI
jgi:hypothetical protein